MSGVVLLAALTALATAGCARTLLRPGELVAAELRLWDPRFDDGARFHEFAFAGTRGDTVTALLSSEDFDALLLLTDWHGERLAENDDAGGDCNARLTYVIRRNGLYRLYATSSSGSELGAFRLELRRSTALTPAPFSPRDTVCRGFGPVAGMVMLGETIMSALDADDPSLEDSTYFELWTLTVPIATMFTVDVASIEFDPYVQLLRGRGDELGADDDGGPGCAARLTHIVWDARPLRILVSSSSVPPWQTGDYFLRVRAGGLPRDSATDCRFGLVAAGRDRRARAIEVGQRASGELTANDQQLPQDSTYAQWWTVRGAPGDPVTIDLVSDAFDAYLIVTGPGLETPLEDDDSGGGCHARITLAFPTSGEYEIVVNTTERLATGAFVLSIVTGAPPPVHGRCERAARDGAERERRAIVRPSGSAQIGDMLGTRFLSSLLAAQASLRVIAVGQNAVGVVTTRDEILPSDSTYAQAWAIEGRARQTVTIDLRSEDFDPFLYLDGPGLPRRLQDDDSGGTCNARLTVTFPQTATYTIVVNTAVRNATGGFTLSVTAGSTPASLARCARVQ